jgi:hypothetical protein
VEDREISIHKPGTNYSFNHERLRDLIFPNNNRNEDCEHDIILIRKEKIVGKSKKNSIYPPVQESYRDSEDFNPTLFRLFVKNGEYVYARANDIIMIESCDHLVKVYLGINSKAKLTVRHNTLKDFLLQLPRLQFIRISRFCAVNILRLSGGNCNEQTFEFDFTISIKLAHCVSHKVFSTIGK